MQSFKGTGCDWCQDSGYTGRLGLYEVLAPDNRMRHRFASEAVITETALYAKGQGFLTLRDDAFNKVCDCLTSREEVLRVLVPE